MFFASCASHRRKSRFSVSVACYSSAIGARRPSSLKQASATASSAVSPIQHPHQPGRPFIHIAVSPSASVYVVCIVRVRPSLPTWLQLFDFVPTPASPPQYVPTFMPLIRRFLFHHHSPHHPSIVNSSHHPAPAPKSFCLPFHIFQTTEIMTFFSSQLSRLHWWYSVGLFPTGVFATFSGSLLVPAFAPPLVVQCRAFPHRGFCYFQWFFVGPE